jgi:hypothetical protein
MCKDVLITGVTVTQQMKKAKEILQTKVIPREKIFRERKKNSSLNSGLIDALKANA